MVNIVLVSHADVGAALVRAAEMIAGPAEGVYAVSLLPEDSPESFGEKLDGVLAHIEGQETLILIDLFGGTPYNVAARQVLKETVECVTGVNLPMVLELLMSRDDATASELAASIATAGKESVRNLGPLLGR
ncbi:MAG: PTS sugar transporter subunit IIA [Anaerolineae bacterium]|nr:PTS sugar transporter subunit IIA [Anaerolineae bacterium]